MKIFKEKEKFIEMRAQGISFSKISKGINVSKPILIEWNREFEKEIAHRQFLAAEELLERYDLMRMARLERFTTLLNSALSELKKRNLELLSSKELLDLIRYLEARLSEESSKISYVTDKIAASSFPFEAELEKIPLFD